MDLLIFVITTLALGVLCSIPGILIGRYLVAKGMATDQSILALVSSILGVLLARLVVPNVPLVYIFTLFLFLAPLGVYRHDLWTTFRSGKWWWSKKSTEQKSLFSLPVSIILSIGLGAVILILIFSVWILLTDFVR